MRTRKDADAGSRRRPACFGLLGPGHPLRGGIVHHNAMLFDALKAEGHGICAVGYSSLYPRFLFPGTTMVDHSLSPLGARARPLLDPVRPWTWRQVVNQFHDSGVKAVVIHWWHSFHGPCLGRVARGLNRRGIPPVFLIHNAEPHDGMPFSSLLTRYALNGAHALIVQNRKTEENLKTRFPDKRLRLVPHPLYTPEAFGESRPNRAEARMALGIDTRAHVLLFFGNVRRYKGLDLLLEAFKKTTVPGLHLLVAGEFYHDASALKTRLTESEFMNRVTLLDQYIPNEEVSRVMTAADLVVLPYHRGSQSGVFSLASGHGRPVLATNVGGLPEYIENGVTGYTVPPDDAVAMARTLDRFFKNQEGPRMESEIRNRTEHSTWKDLARCISDLVLNPEPAHPDRTIPDRTTMRKQRETNPV